MNWGDGDDVALVTLPAGSSLGAEGDPIVLEAGSALVVDRMTMFGVGVTGATTVEIFDDDPADPDAVLLWHGQVPEDAPMPDWNGTLRGKPGVIPVLRVNGGVALGAGSLRGMVHMAVEKAS